MPGPVLLPMMRATGLGPLPALLEERASWQALEKSFAAEKIPLAVIENKNVFLPFESTTGLFERAAHATGDRLFGLRVGQAMAPTEYGLWLEYAACAGSLGQGLRRLQASTRFQQPGGRVTIDIEGAFAIWRYFKPTISHSSIQHSDHVLFPVIRFIKAFLGQDWRPSWIELDYRRDSAAGEMEELLGAPVRFERPGLGVAVEREQLNCTKSDANLPARSRHVTLAELEASYTELSRGEPLQSILSIVTLRLLDGHADIDGAAEMAGMGIQTLQRMLRRDGLSYRQVVDLARSARARELLRQTDRAVTDIALDLGYTDHANFTRAFSRWLGCSPTDYRNHPGNGQAGILVSAGG